MPLAKEKQILKHIHKLERSKRDVEDFVKFDDKIKATKVRNLFQMVSHSLSSSTKLTF